ncbi:hypothetical protein H7X87_02250 [Acetobacteraceae bacterium]|nr:hypothetical protein [Candidatus Parcubacteria bacterium]
MPYINRKGTTRLVVLVGPYVLKFARVRIFFPFVRILAWHREGQMVATAIREKHREFSFKDILHILFLAGLQANLREYRLCRKYPLAPLAWTYATLGGWINIQRRGMEGCTGQDAHSLLGPFDPNILRSVDAWEHNLGIIEGKCCLIDYGAPGVEEFLKERYSCAK